MFKKKADSRFETVHQEGTASGCKVLVDKETGVYYLFSWAGSAGGLTPLLDKDGKPFVEGKNN